jgi:iron-sulfur cluster assembly accessory protein
MIGLSSVDVFVEFTDSAKKEIKRQIELTNDKDLGVRIFVMLDKFAGFAFDLEFSKADPEEDYVAKVDGIPVMVDKTFLEYVKGMSIDYDPEAHEFSLKNEKPQYNCVPGTKYECPSCNLYEDRIADPEYNPTLES